MAYSITVNITSNKTSVMVPISTYVYGKDTNVTSIEAGESATLDFIADGLYYIFQATSSVTVDGATKINWVKTNTTASLTIGDAVANVTINIVVNALNTPASRNAAFYLSTKVPLDTRLVMTKKEMLNASKLKQPEVYFCICRDDGKFYLWDSVRHTKSAETGFFQSYEDAMDLAQAINSALADPTKKAALDTAMGVALPGAVAKAMDDPDRAQAIADAMFDSEHFQVTVDKKIDIAIDLIQAIESK